MTAETDRPTPDVEECVVPCCRRPDAYCECSQRVRGRAVANAIAAQDCPPAPPLAADDPARYELPPF